MMQIMDLAEMGGALNGLLGSWLLAVKCNQSRYAWIAYLISNLFWLVFAVMIGRNWLLLQTIGFTLSSLVGVWNYLIIVRYPSLPAFTPTFRVRKEKVRV